MPLPEIVKNATKFRRETRTKAASNCSSLQSAQGGKGERERERGIDRERERDRQAEPGSATV